MAELSAQGAVIKAAYEGEDDTNAFTDARRDKLDGIATGAQRVATGAVTPYSGDLDFSGGLGGGGGGSTALADITDWPAAVTATEVSYLDGVTNAIQTQIDGKSDDGHGHTLADISDAGTAAASDTGDFATAAQGVLADSAVQPAALNEVGIVTVSASRTLAASDAGKVLRVTADAVTLTVDDGVFTAGQVVTIRLATTGTVTIADGTAAVTPVSGYAQTISTDRAQATLHFVSASAADLTGGLDAA